MTTVRPEYNWVPVESTAVVALCFKGSGFIDQQRGRKSLPYGTLYVCFQDGDVYSYTPIIEAQYEAILHARSVGRALWRVLQPGSGQKVGTTEHKKEVKHIGRRRARR